MCFSASASIAAGTVLSAAGGITVAKAKRRAQLPLAAVPLLFGVQQLAEGLVWLSFGWGMPWLNAVGTYAFSLFAFVIWPIYVPFAVGLLERAAWRKEALYLFQLVGVVVGGYLLYMHTLTPVTSSVVGQHVVYAGVHLYQAGLILLYLAATVGSCLVSSERIIRMLGALTLIFAGAAYWFYTQAFVSVWCFFAAVLSGVVLVYFYRGR